MKLAIRLLSSCLLVFGSCASGDNEDPTPPVPPPPAPNVLLTLDVKDTYQTSYRDNWIFIHDSNGELLEYKPFESNDKLVIETDKTLSGNLISVTTISYSAQGENKNYLIYGFMDVAKGSTMVLNMNPSLQVLDSDGQFTAKITDIADIDQYTLTSNVGFGGTGTMNGSTLEVTEKVFKESPKYILQASNLTDIKYKVIDNVKVGDNYTVPFSDMLAFDQVTTFDFPETNSAVLFVRGREAGVPVWGPGYLLNAHYAPDLHTSIKSGYLNSLSNYTTFLTLSYPGYRLVYNNFGSVPALHPTINWPKASDFSFTSKSVNSFSSNGPAFSWRRSEWSYYNPSAPGIHIVNCLIYSPNKTQTINAFPAEFIAQHPLLSFENLKHAETTFFTEAQPYSTFVERTFAGDVGDNGAEVGITFLN